MRIVDADTMRAIDHAAVKSGARSGLELMEAAGIGVADVAVSAFGEFKRAVIVAGKGSNGGDGYVAARHLKERGVDARVFSVVRPDELLGDAALMARRWQDSGGETVVVSSKKAFERHAGFLEDSLIIDALLGTGLKSAPRGVYATAIDFINRPGPGSKILSIDIPSGVDAATGAVFGKAVRAHVTATMALPKLGLYLYPGRKLRGRVVVVDIGIPDKLVEGDAKNITLIDYALAARLVRPREPDSHKGDFGHLAVIAGGRGKTGAAVLAATAALRSGAGLVTVGVPASLAMAVESRTIEAMTRAINDLGAGVFVKDSLDDALGLLKGKDAVVLGPGVGRSAATAGFIRALCANKNLPPLLLDADGLNAFEGGAKFLKKTRAKKVLTPHPKEAGRLLGMTVKEVQADRISAAGELAKITGAVVLLKGATTIIASPDGRIYLNPTGSPALATAGTGDVLSGMIGALLANGLDVLDAAVLGAYVHGLAGEAAARKRGGPIGAIASDLFEEVPPILNRLALD
jgi:NAD(P)H-hydrate epimerase